MTTGTIEYSTATGRGVVLAAVLGSGMAMLDGTVVNVGLRTIGTDLHASLAQLQWISNGYLLMLASLILLGGALGDRFGRRRIFIVGVVAFAGASMLCGVAPNPSSLIVARVLQGVGGAMLTPGSLAIIEATFVRADRGRAIGAWTGLGSIAAAIGPIVGGALVEYASWRWIFWINAPIAGCTVFAALRFIPESKAPSPGRFDVPGAVLGALSLAGITYCLIEWGRSLAVLALVMGLLSAAAFVIVEHRTRYPMLPLDLFASRVFSAANAMTFLVYAALGAVLFFLVICLQTVLGYGALRAGLSTFPITVIMLVFAPRAGALATRIGPRIPMTIGPLAMAGGVAWLSQLDAGSSYWLDLLPPLVVFGLGLALMVAPLTATVLAAASDDRAGIASGVNNAVARAGSLFAVAALPAVVGLSGNAYEHPAVFASAYSDALMICAALLAAGGAVSWLMIPHEALAAPDDEEPREGQALAGHQLDCPHLGH